MGDTFRILHVFDHSLPLQSGYTFRSREILAHQRGLGWGTVHITSPKHPYDGRSEEEADGFLFHRSPPLNGLRARLPGLAELGVIDALEQGIESVLAKSGRPDIIHAHSPALNGVAALRVARRHGLPLVYEVRAFWEDAAVDHGTAREWGPRYRATRAMETYVLRSADAVTTICEGLRGEMTGRGIPVEEIVVVPNAVDVDRFRPGGTRRHRELMAELGLQDNFVLGFIGSFYAYEGLDSLISAIPAIVERIPNARLVLVGGGPQEDLLRELARNPAIAPYVVFTGRVPHQDISVYYDIVDLFVYPRRSVRLTELVTPLKPLEAMAHGRAVLASDIGGHRELIDAGVTGMLYPVDDTDELIEAVQAMTDGSFRERLSTCGRRFVESERNWDVCIRRYAPVYERVTQRTRGNPSGL